MIFRVTQKASSKLRVACFVHTASGPTIVEWYCNLMTVRRRQVFLFTHALSLFSFWIPAAGTTLANFGDVFRRHATDTLGDYGFSQTDAATVMDNGPDMFAKPADRGIIGSMVDFGKMLSYTVDYEDGLDRLTSRALNDSANDCSMNKIGMEHPAAYLRRVLVRQAPHNLKRTGTITNRRPTAARQLDAR